MARNDGSQERTPQGRVDLLRCEHERCGRVWHRPQRPGPVPRFCSDACKQADFRARSKLGPAARQAYLADQERRRAAWRGWEAAEWLRAEQQRRQRAEASVFSDLFADGQAADVDGAEEQAEARATVFFLAGVDDDGQVGLPEAFRLAAQRATTSPAVVGRQLMAAKRLLQAHDRWDG